MEENIPVRFGMPAARLQAVNDCYQTGHHILARWGREPGHNLTLIARNRTFESSSLQRRICKPSVPLSLVEEESEHLSIAAVPRRGRQ
jgi:hypothetical protein